MSKAADPSHLCRSPEALLRALPALPAQGFTFRGNSGLWGLGGEAVLSGVHEALYLVPITQKGPVPQVGRGVCRVYDFLLSKEDTFN